VQRGEAAVVGVDDQADAGGQQLGPGGVGLDIVPEAEAVGHALDLAVLQLGLGDGGVEVDLPQGRGVGLVGQALGQQAQERPLGGPPGLLADGGVGERPVDRQTASKACSSSMVSWLQSSMKLGRETAMGCRDGHSGGSKDGL
jgi:hypothetical protein